MYKHSSNRKKDGPPKWISGRNIKFDGSGTFSSVIKERLIGKQGKIHWERQKEIPPRYFRLFVMGDVSMIYFLTDLSFIYKRDTYFLT